jgi:hypothetical protein
MKNNDVRHYTTPTHLVWEEVGSEVVILDTTSHTTHRLTGTHAATFLAAATGRPVTAEEVASLAQRGFLEPRSPISRRHLMAGSAAGLGLTITSLSLPTVAMASSTQPKPTITAESLEAGEWRWTTGQNLVITQTGSQEGLPTNGIFVAGDAWQLTLDGFAGLPAESDGVVVTSGQVAILTLTFTFPFTGGLTAPTAGTILEGTLTKVSDNTVFSEPFPIPQL